MLNVFLVGVGPLLIVWLPLYIPGLCIDYSTVCDVWLCIVWLFPLLLFEILFVDVAWSIE